MKAIVAQKANLQSIFTVYIEQDEDGIFVGSIPSIPSCYAQGDTQEEMLANLQEVLALCWRNFDAEEIGQSKFVGIKNLTMTHA